MHPASRSRSSSLPRGPMMPRPSGQPSTSAIGRLTCAVSAPLRQNSQNSLQQARSASGALAPAARRCRLVHGRASNPSANASQGAAGRNATLVRCTLAVTPAEQAHCRAPRIPSASARLRQPGQPGRRRERDQARAERIQLARRRAQARRRPRRRRHQHRRVGAQQAVQARGDGRAPPGRLVRLRAAQKHGG